MPDAGGCPNCSRPLAAGERLCTACGYSREQGGVVETRVRPRSAVDVVAHAAGRVLLDPFALGLIVSGLAVALAMGSAGDAQAVQIYSVMTGVVCIVATILQVKYWWLEASPMSAFEMKMFGWIAVVFSGQTPPSVRISTMLAVTMAIATGILRLNLERSGIGMP